MNWLAMIMPSSGGDFDWFVEIFNVSIWVAPSSGDGRNYVLVSASRLLSSSLSSHPILPIDNPSLSLSFSLFPIFVYSVYLILVLSAALVVSHSDWPEKRNYQTWVPKGPGGGAWTKRPIDGVSRQAPPTNRCDPPVMQMILPRS